MLITIEIEPGLPLLREYETVIRLPGQATGWNDQKVRVWAASHTEARGILVGLYGAAAVPESLGVVQNRAFTSTAGPA